MIARIGFATIFLLLVSGCCQLNTKDQVKEPELFAIQKQFPNGGVNYVYTKGEGK